LEEDHALTAFIIRELGNVAPRVTRVNR
jgi:hypothetical protein